MNEIEVRKFLEALPYPRLNKTLGELSLVESVIKKGQHIGVVLRMTHEESFQAVKILIETGALKQYFESITVEKVSKKEISYGNTNTPNNKAPYAKKVIAVTSGKGGVGKSTISANLSVALAQEGYKVGLLDADVYGPNIPRMLGVSEEKMQWNESNKIIPSENFGIKIMSVALTTPQEDTPLVWRSSVAVSALIQFLEDVEWGELDFLVIDMPPGTGDVQLTMAQELPIAAAVVVTTPQMVSIDDVSRAIMMFKETNIPVGGLIENMSYFIAPDTKKEYKIFGEGAGKTTALKYKIPFLGAIPLDMEIREKCDNGTPIVALGNEMQKSHYKTILSNLFKSL